MGILLLGICGCVRETQKHSTAKIEPSKAVGAETAGSTGNSNVFAVTIVSATSALLPEYRSKGTNANQAAQDTARKLADPDR